ncbi:MAG: hypothetical protein EA361_15860 [Bacteroidetes bacterium]|nr:MAG: hypothetical protein EA361_15860 [Bacteroidota bacterium]
MLLLSIADIPLYLAIGFAASIIGALPFGLVNLSVLQSAVNKGIRSTLPVSGGASVVEIGYGIVGIFAGKLIWEYTHNNLWFHIISASILLITGGVFFARKQRFDFNLNPAFGGFTYGILLNLLSLQVLAYWIITGSILSSAGFLPHAPATIAIFLAGIGMGKMGTLWAYAYFGEEIIGRSVRISRNINRLVGIILMAVAGIVMVKGVM